MRGKMRKRFTTNAEAKNRDVESVDVKMSPTKYP